MFLKIENQLFNADYLQYFEYSDNILQLFFSGNLQTDIQQNEKEYNDFVNLFDTNKNVIFLKSNFGINLNNVNGIYKKEENVIVYFIDSTSKQIENISFDYVENKILGE